MKNFKIILTLSILFIVACNVGCSAKESKSNKSYNNEGSTKLQTTSTLAQKREVGPIPSTIEWQGRIYHVQDEFIQNIEDNIQEKLGVADNTSIRSKKRIISN